jgi:hypothetical protein
MKNGDALHAANVLRLLRITCHTGRARLPGKLSIGCGKRSGMPILSCPEISAASENCKGSRESIMFPRTTCTQSSAFRINIDESGGRIGERLMDSRPRPFPVAPFKGAASFARHLSHRAQLRVSVGPCVRFAKPAFAIHQPGPDSADGGISACSAWTEDRLFRCVSHPLSRWHRLLEFRVGSLR